MICGLRISAQMKCKSADLSRHAPAAPDNQGSRTVTDWASTLSMVKSDSDNIEKVIAVQIDIENEVADFMNGVA